MKFKNIKSSIKKIRLITIGSYKLLVVIFCMMTCLQTNAQTFTTTGHALYDYYGYYYRQEFQIEVSELPKIADTLFGLEAALLTLHHIISTTTPGLRAKKLLQLHKVAVVVCCKRFVSAQLSDDGYYMLGKKIA